ncbi:MAG: SH3 domain-containing protein [Leptospiraceae bacterium]|nr:SH3 domain-containing protein [Leptospiraceae bacterium]
MNEKDGLYLRKLPTRDSEQLALIPNTTFLVILGISKDTSSIYNKTSFWYEVKYKNKKGWVWGGLLKKK